MSEHRATVEWQRSSEFRYETYSRAHTLNFDGIPVPGNAAPGNIVTLRPKVTFSGKRPSAEEHRALHHQAHQKCYIANSVKTEVLIEPC